MQAGNAHYRRDSDLPETVPVFPLNGALLLPLGRLPLTIFEPRYIAMVDDALASNRLIGMIQTMADTEELEGEPGLKPVGCAGRIVSFSENGDGRYLILLEGISRFRVTEEISGGKPYRQVRSKFFISDLDQALESDAVDRDSLLEVFQLYLEANGLETDWEMIRQADNALLVNSLCMMAPYGPAEKQALLEAPDLKSRAETLIAITEMELAKQATEPGSTRLQ
ncbi:LON peptidase substrate-binding domain-containing protein [Limoniibacter endophyticus]|uniref:LON peptidase substrate-binding domain-containing protein n=1 Tax=Limoniibacter endophyticus TaxID=1565040 RepID=UPI00167C11AD|nr:LON peptidase substrate-binding domain-containing protein [Limoniibacter endophyticus]